MSSSDSIFPDLRSISRWATSSKPIVQAHCSSEQPE